jgi:hypothetical protein
MPFNPWKVKGKGGFQRCFIPETVGLGDIAVQFSYWVDRGGVIFMMPQNNNQ